MENFNTSGDDAYAAMQEAQVGSAAAVDPTIESVASGAVETGMPPAPFTEVENAKIRSELDASGLVPVEEGSATDVPESVETASVTAEMNPTHEAGVSIEVGSNTGTVEKATLVASLRELNKQSDAIWKAYREDPVVIELKKEFENLNSLNEKYRASDDEEKSHQLKKEINSLNERIAPLRQAHEELEKKRTEDDHVIDDRMNSIRRTLEEITLNETEQQVAKDIIAEPSRLTLEQIVELSNNETREGGEYYSGPTQFMADVSLVRSSNLPNEEKLKIIHGLGRHVQSGVIGDDRSNLLKKYKKELTP